MIDEVFHVSVSGDGDEEGGIYSPQAFDRRFSHAYAFMQERDADFMQYGSDAEKSVIIKRCDADDFKASQVIL